MPRPRLAWQLLAATMLVTLAALAMTVWLASYALQQLYLASVRRELASQADLLERQVQGPLSTDDTAALAAICRGFIQSTSHRVTLVLASGKVLIDTHEDPAVMDNHANRPEIQEALAGRPGASERYSSTLRQRMTYLAVPIRRDGQITGVLRVAVSAAAIDEAVHGAQLQIAGGAVLVFCLAGLAAWGLARRTSRTVETLRRGAERFAQGDLANRIEAPNAAELAGLAEALNHMAHQLRERIRTTARQHTEQTAVLASMAEGVLAVDTEERVISLNQAAAELLGSDPAEAQGRALQEVIRNAELRRFVTSALSCQEPIEGDVVLGTGHDRVLQAHGTALRDAAGHAIGAVIVLNDVTQLRRLESVRRDFVANVSHELKTPITSIKGFVETLLDGALRNPDDAQRFLHIIARQADRLDQIIEDLLTLSKVEQGEEAGDIALASQPLRPVLEEALDELRPRADERQIALRLTCQDHIQASINPPLLEQAVINLLDNALKYSEPGREVDVAVDESPREVAISVRDQGCGIEAEHLPRLFERFYRVDKARSRKLGGTGLGLAIVKHIVIAHYGQITVDSTPGKGSTFTIRLPRQVATMVDAGVP